MSRRDTETPMRARVPADVERKDAILFGFTFRQLAILTVAGLLIYTAWTALAKTVPPVEFLIGAIPIAGAAFVLAVGRRDGISLDAWLAHAIRHRRSPHRLVPVDGPIALAPAWVSTTGGHQRRTGIQQRVRPGHAGTGSHRWSATGPVHPPARHDDRPGRLTGTRRPPGLDGVQ